MRNIKVTLSYDGTNYSGWQIQSKQPHVKTLQSTIQESIQNVLQESCQIIASGRTDSGVHALGQVINFHTSSKIPTQKIPYALNSTLPQDIVVLVAEEVEKKFHSRYDARKKWYRYIIDNGNFQNVFWRNYSYFVHPRLDINLMKVAGQIFKGKHDFTSFCATGTSVTDFKRTINVLRISQNENFIFIDVQGDGFLYNMVRILSGTLIEVGKGKINPSAIKDIINAKDRSQAGPTAPAKGLLLMKVYY